MISVLIMQPFHRSVFLRNHYFLDNVSSIRETKSPIMLDGHEEIPKNIDMKSTYC